MMICPFRNLQILDRFWVFEKKSYWVEDPMAPLLIEDPWHLWKQVNRRFSFLAAGLSQTV